MIAVGLTKSWDGRTVLRGISFELRPGTITWLCGDNGSGKTTLLRICSGLIRSDAGTVTFDGLTPVGHRRRWQERVRMCSAGDRGIVARITVRQQLEYWCGLMLMRPSTAAARIAETSELLRLDELLSQRTDRLSLGQRQRVRLALALLRQPDVLLLDEPAASLDADGLGVLSAVLIANQERGACTMWAGPTGAPAVIPHDQQLVLSASTAEFDDSPAR